MRRIAVIFLVAVFVPSLLLGYLALRTAGEQRNILERQLAEIYQNDADILAAQLRQAVLERQREFSESVRRLLSTQNAHQLASDFGQVFQPASGAAFAIAPGGSVASADPRSKADERFLRNQEAFLNNRAAVEFFPTQQSSGIRSTATNAQVTMNTLQRKVQPRNANFEEDALESNFSRVAAQYSDFQTAISGGADGVIARFVQNELVLFLYTRPPEGDGYVFGLALRARDIASFVKDAFVSLAPDAHDAVIAVLDEHARPVAISRPYEGDWRHPFTASEIGEALPHWEAAVYLLQPAQIADSARLITVILILLIALALAAILGGGAVIALDARRQLALAQKKTDFVSNVSHELKTPLTSIRMFAELLEQGRVDEPAKSSRYLRIIILETERLTRLINNVLDFARMSRKHKTYDMTAQDLFGVIERAWESQSVHLREAGFACGWEASDAPYPVVADADAIGQVLVNLLSNAEKYAGERREVLLQSRRENGSVLVSVLDRGIGVPEGEGKRIFEAFHRANDSLANAVQGSGLGLTLARDIARDHGGDVEYRRREGGGSIFTLRLPAAKPENPS